MSQEPVKETRLCPKCKQVKPLEAFRKKTKIFSCYYQCDSCRKRQSPDYNSRKGKQSRDALKQKIIKALGGKCKRCGFDDPRALQVDHINGHGLAQIREFSKAHKSPRAYRNYILESIEQGRNEFQLLCANCNWIKRFEEGENRWKYEQRKKTH